MLVCIKVQARDRAQKIRWVMGWTGESGWAGRGTSSCSIGMAHDDDAGSLCLGCLLSVAPITQQTHLCPSMPIHAHAHAHAHTSAPSLRHPRDVCHTTPSHALRNCTAFHNPRPRLQPRRMGDSDLRHTREIAPCPRMSCECAFAYSMCLSLASPFFVCLHLSRAYKPPHREPPHTPSIVFAPPSHSPPPLVAGQQLPKLVRPGC